MNMMENKEEGKGPRMERELGRDTKELDQVKAPPGADLRLPSSNLLDLEKRPVINSSICIPGYRNFL